MWVEDGEVPSHNGKKLKAGELWAVALSGEGRYLAGTSADGKIGVWDLLGEGPERRKIREYETKGSFGLCIDMVSHVIPSIYSLNPPINEVFTISDAS
jgi:superkiller protein 8